MLIHQKIVNLPIPEPQDIDLLRLASAGRQIAKGLRIEPPSSAAASIIRHRAHDAEVGNPAFLQNGEDG